MTDPTPADPTPPPAAPAPDPTPAPQPAAAPAAASMSPSPSATTAAGARPTGITILAVLAAIEAVFGLLGGFGLLFVGTLGLGGATLLGIALLALAGLGIAFAYGAWTLQPWAWPLGVAFAGFGVITNLLGILNNPLGSIVGIAIAGAILYYLNQPGIKSLFGRA